MDDWLNLLTRLIQPSTAIHDAAQRRLAQLQLVMLLAILIMGSVVVGIFAPQTEVPARALGLGGAMMVVTFGCYLVSRTRHFRRAAYMMTIAVSVCCLAFAIWVPNPEVALAYLSLVTLLSIYVLPVRYSVGLSAVNLVLVSLLVASGHLATDPVLQALSFYMMASILFLIIGAIRQRDLRAIETHTRILAERESLYRGVVQDQSEMICRCKADGTITFTNLAYAQHFKLSPSEMVGLNLYSLLSPARRDALLKEFRTLTPDQPSSVYEYHNPAKNIWQLWTNRAIFDEQGQVTEYQGVGRDITALKSIESQYRGLVEASPDAIIIHDLEGVILFANPAAAKLVGLATPDAIVGMSVLDFSTSKNHEALCERLRAVVANPSQVTREESHVQRLDGALRDVEISASAFNFQGQICIHKVIRDITEHKEAERVLRHQQQRLRALYLIAAHPTPDLDERLNYLLQTGVVVLNVEFGTISTLDNNSFRVLHVYDSRQRLQSPHTHDLNREYCQLAYHGSSVLTVPNGHPRIHNQLGAYIGIPLMSEDRPIGVLSFGSVEPHAAFNDSDIDFVRLMGQWVVTALEREKSAQALAASEHRYRTLIESATDIVYQTDLNGRLTYSNSAASRFTGYSPAELKDMDGFALIPPDHRRMVQRFYQWQIHERIEQTYYEMPIVSRQGEQLWLGQNVQLLMINDLPTGFSAIARDITQRRQAESEREQLIQELDAFAHTVAHDLKNPLALMIGYSSLLVDGVESQAEADKLMAILNRTTHRMNRIIHEMLRLAEVRSVAEVNVEPLDMGNVWDEVIDHLQYMIEQSTVQISLPPQWPSAVGYAPWVEEVWANYLSNAIKYGGNPPCIEVGGTLLANGFTRFWIRDNGKGLSEDQQQLLFRQFSRVGLTIGGGHGLGLSIVKRIVERLGGSVGVESVAGQGCTFWFTLPTLPKLQAVSAKVPA